MEAHVHAQLQVPVELPSLRIDANGRWFALPDGTTINIGRRNVLRRILRTLAQHRVQSAGEPVSLSTLFENVWPGEQSFPDCIENRIRVGIATLRKLGLKNNVITVRQGYRLDTAVEIV
jgi:DNA-binding winged helix-turn-helix (wHTH) protein